MCTIGYRAIGLKNLGMKRFLFILLPLMACEILPPQSACEQQQLCLSGHARCPECDLSNFVEVCTASREAEISPVLSCSQPACQEAAQLYDDYLLCVATSDCGTWRISSSMGVIVCNVSRDKYQEARSNCYREQISEDGTLSCIL